MRSSPLRSWIAAFALCVAAVLLCMAYVDRPVADYVQANIRGTALFGWTVRALTPLPAVLVLILALFLASGAWALGGRPLAPWTETPLLCAWALVWAFATTIVLKQLFGRSWPDPAWVMHRAYAFHPLRGGPGYEAFPSGTAAVAGAMLAVLWIRAPRLRAAYALLFALACAGVVVINGHWVADVIAGGFLGASIGWMTVRLLRR
jgi:membrane-associated phospholipid phosphatase